MSDNMYLYIGIIYFVISAILITLTLVLINKYNKKKYNEALTILERDKNLIISASILSELNKRFHHRTSLVAQWMRLCLSMQATWTRIPDLGIFHTSQAAQVHGPQLLSPGTPTTESTYYNYGNPCT